MIFKSTCIFGYIPDAIAVLHVAVPGERSENPSEIGHISPTPSAQLNLGSELAFLELW